MFAEGTEQKRVLFAGYAPIHFICFRPIYARLSRMKGVDVWLSGGRTNPNGSALTAQRLYRPFRIPRERILELDEIYEQSFDVVFSAHVSGYFPKEDRHRVQLFHGVSFRNMAVRRDVLIYDSLFVIGPYMRRLFTEQQLLRKSDPKLLDIGFPKLDRLVNGRLERLLKRLGLSGRRPIILYAPTGQVGNSLENQGEEVIRRLRATKKYDLLIKLHDHPRDRSSDWPTRLTPLADAHTKLIRDYDVVPYLFVADLLLTDASSVSSEYSLMDRPMVFLDVPELLANMAKRRKKVPMDLNTWGRKGGVTCRWPDEAVEAIEWSLAHPEHSGDVRRAMAQDLFFNPGHATDAALRWIRDLLRSER